MSLAKSTLLQVLFWSLPGFFSHLLVNPMYSGEIFFWLLTLTHIRHISLMVFFIWPTVGNGFWFSPPGTEFFSSTSRYSAVPDLYHPAPSSIIFLSSHDAECFCGVFFSPSCNLNNVWKTCLFDWQLCFALESASASSETHAQWAHKIQTHLRNTEQFILEGFFVLLLLFLLLPFYF